MSLQINELNKAMILYKVALDNQQKYQHQRNG